MNLRVIKAGVLDTVQDLGRYGWQHLGVNPGGVMDKLSAQWANILVGNDPCTAVIELHFPASEFFFERPALVAITGGDFSVQVNGEDIPLLHPVWLGKYSILQFQRLKAGSRVYIAVRNGFALEPWLNSLSTNSKLAAGGYKGRSFQKDDEVPLHEIRMSGDVIQKKEFYVFPWKADTNWGDPFEKEIAVLPGKEWDLLTGESREKFFDQSYVPTPQSDRMGYTLRADALKMSVPEEMISSAVCFGTVQLLPDGQLILLMADHQTTGGYPRIAHVISAHHHKLAQVRPGESISFRITDHETAEALLVKQQHHLQQLQNACTFRLGEYLHENDRS
jgi:antagonist of KipI